MNIAIYMRNNALTGNGTAIDDQPGRIERLVPLVDGWVLRTDYNKNATTSTRYYFSKDRRPEIEVAENHVATHDTAIILDYLDVLYAVQAPWTKTQIAD